MSTQQKRKFFQKINDVSIISGRSLSVLNSGADQVIKHWFLAKKPMTSSWLATMVPPVDITVLTTQQENVKENLKWDKMLQNSSKFVKSLTSWGMTFWGHSHHPKATNTYSWQLITCQNGLKQKRSPPMTPELFTNFFNLSSPDSDCPDCEDSRACSFAFRVSHPQLHFGNPETDIQEKNKKKANALNPRRNGKDQCQRISAQSYPYPCHIQIINLQSSFNSPSLASLGHNDSEFLYTASGLLDLADLDPYYCSDNQYAVSIKEDMAYLCLHSPKTMKET
ncbi:hypothetical protein Tco_1318327 [Tanacetum coccineum]